MLTRAIQTALPSGNLERLIKHFVQRAGAAGLGQGEFMQKFLQLISAVTLVAVIGEAAAVQGPTAGPTVATSLDAGGRPALPVVREPAAAPRRKAVRRTQPRPKPRTEATLGAAPTPSVSPTPSGATDEKRTAILSVTASPMVEAAVIDGVKTISCNAEASVFRVGSTHLATIDLLSNVAVASSGHEGSFDAVLLVGSAAEMHGDAILGGSWFGVGVSPTFGWQSANGPIRYEAGGHVGLWGGDAQENAQGRILKKFSGFAGFGYATYWIKSEPPPLGEPEAARVGGAGVHAFIEYLDLTTTPGVSLELDGFGWPGSAIFELWAKAKLPIPLSQNIALVPAVEARYLDSGAEATAGSFYDAAGAAYEYRLQHSASIELSAGIEWSF